MLRPALLPLIRRVRALMGEQDEDFACSFFADDAIADALDARALHLVRVRLTCTGDSGTGERIWASTFRNFDEAATLSDVNHLPVQASYSDFIAGKWAVATSVGQVFVSGTSYDLYGSAADLLLTKAVAKSARFDVQSGDQKLSRSQEAAALRELAAQYRKKARPTCTTVTRSDVR